MIGIENLFPSYDAQSDRYFTRGVECRGVQIEYAEVASFVNGTTNFNAPIISLRKEGSLYHLVTLDDLVTHEKVFDKDPEAGVRGFIHERIAAAYLRLVLKSNMSGGLSVPSESTNDRYSFRQTGQNNFHLFESGSSDQKAELDGFFLFDEYFFGLETKSGGFSIDAQDISERVINPLKDLFPNRKPVYVLSAYYDKLFVKLHDSRSPVNFLNHRLNDFYKGMKENDTEVIFFPIQNSRAANQKIGQYSELVRKLLNGKTVQTLARVEYNHGRKVAIRFGDGRPVLILSKVDGTWVELPAR